MGDETPPSTAVSDESPSEKISRESFHGSWDKHATYLYENTSLSKRQAQVEALRQFGYSRGKIAETLDVSPNTVDDHSSKLAEKVEWAQSEQVLVLVPRQTEFSRFAPELVGAVTTQFPDGADRVSLYENQAVSGEPDGDPVLSKTDAPVYALVFERTLPTDADIGLRTTTERWFHPTFEHLLFNSLFSRPFANEHRVDALARLIAGVKSTYMIGRLHSLRESLYESLSDLYEDAVTDGDTDPKQIAKQFGLDPAYVEHHVTEYTGITKTNE
jgi:DNA-binding CsgD family transcriptional regulator